MNCIKCREEMHPKRIALGYNKCIQCSDTEAYGVIDVVYHKTGNTIEITDKHTAERINKLGSRTGFGIMRGLRPGKQTKSKTKLSDKPVNQLVDADESEEAYDTVGASMMDIYETNGLQPAIEYVINQNESYRISFKQRSRLIHMLRLIHKSNPTPAVHSSKEAVTDDVEWVFRNWRR